jgi:hypothetical protein
VNLWAGFYALEISAWRRLESPWKQAGFSFETMSPMVFLRTLIQGQPLPARVRIPGLDRALYQVYRQHESQGEREASRQVKQVAQQFGQTLYRSRERLLQEGPVVLFVLEYLEHGMYWRAGIRHRGTGQPQELFRLEWLFPRCDVTQVDGEIVCFGQF